MEGWLIDSYRIKNAIVLWVKTKNGSIRIEKPYVAHIYADIRARSILDRYYIRYVAKLKQNYLQKLKQVLEIPIPNLQNYEGFVRWLEKKTRYRLSIYNADIPPEQMFLYENDLVPFTRIDITSLQKAPSDFAVQLKKIWIQLEFKNDLYSYPDSQVTSLRIDKRVFEGDEFQILSNFTKYFMQLDPDVLIVKNAFSRIPALASRLQSHNIHCPLHRWDSLPIKYRGGKSFYSYGRVYYRDYGVRLRGRILIDNNSIMSEEVEFESMMELSNLSGARIQQLTSKSFGAVFQFALVRELVSQGLLVPYKEKPVDKPLTLIELLKSDRVGHTLDSKTGFHQDVAEIDFCSMYPWIIYNHNISCDTILSDKGPFEHVPGIPIRISRNVEGIVPKTIKPFLDKRMEYKRNPTSINRVKAKGLKWVLVTSYGYLRYREFKLGIPSSHMAIGAFAREIMIRAFHLAEERGFEVVHGIIDSLYIKKKNISEKEVRAFCKELERVTGIPIAMEGIFRWIVFLPSILDSERPVPTKYYGVYLSGSIKARGIEVRQKNVPKLVKQFQQKALECMSKEESVDSILSCIAQLCKEIRKILCHLPSINPSLLTTSVKVSKVDYTHDLPQKKIVARLKKLGNRVHPGQKIQYIHEQNKVSLLKEYGFKPDPEYYRKLLVRALYILVQPLGAKYKEIMSLSYSESQSTLLESSRAQHVAKLKHEFTSSKAHCTDPLARHSFKG